MGLQDTCGTAQLNAWFASRGIPDKREGSDLICQKEHVSNNRELQIKYLGLCLSDHYWIKREDDKRSWKEVNFFENGGFQKEGDDIYIGEDTEQVSQENTPNATSSGMLPKKWILKGNERYLMKGHESIYRQDPFNEAIASEFLDLLGVDHVSYSLTRYKGSAYSLCKNMLGKDNELISAQYVSRTGKKEKDESLYEHYIQCCGRLGLGENIRMSKCSSSRTVSPG